MALPNQTDKTKDTQTLAEDVGQNAPLTPMGAQEIGATSDQSKMMGTPAQVKANLQMQEAEQEARLKRQEKEAAAEQARLGGQLLSQQERYVEPTPTQQQQAAGQIAETMRVLGPVQSRVQGLIQARLAASQSKQATTIIDLESAKQWLVSNNAKLPDDTNLEALLTSVKNATDQATYETALQGLYDVIYPDGNIPEGFDTTLQGFFKTTEESIKEAATPTGDDYVAATLGELDLSLIGITDDSKQEIADALGISVEAFDNLTLEELNTQIASLEANELSRVEELRNMLEDPTISFAMKKSIYDELRQLGAAGVVGAEQEIQTLQDQIDEANTIEILGETYTLEEALSDDGLSELIARAASDDKLLQAMKDTPGYQSLAQWVETNRTSVKALLDDYGFQAKSFVEVQREYKDMREVLGKDEASLNIMKAIFGIDAFSNSVTTEQFNELMLKAKSSGLYNVLYDAENKVLRKEYSMFLADLKEDPELVKQFTQNDYSKKDIENTVALKIAFDTEEEYLSTLYGGLDGYVSFDDYSGLDKNEDGKLYILDKWQNEVDAGVKSKTGILQADAVKYKGVEKGKAYLTIDDLVNISAATDPDEVMGDLQTWMKSSYETSKKYTGKEGTIKTDILGSEKFDVKDLNVYLESEEGKKNKQAILDIFDADGNNSISQQELDKQDAATLKRLSDFLGLGGDKEDVIGADGDWEEKQIPTFGIGSKLYETSVYKKAEKRNDEINSNYDSERSKYIEEYGYQSVEDGGNVAKATNIIIEGANSIAKSPATNNAFSLFIDGWQDLITEMNNLTGVAHKTSGDGILRMTPTFGWAEIKNYASGNFLSEDEKNLLRDINTNGFPKASFSDGLIDFGNLATKKEMIVSIADKLAEMEGTISSFLDKKTPTGKKYMDLKPAAKHPFDKPKRYTEKLEQQRSDIIGKKNQLMSLLSILDAQAIGDVSRFNEFSNKFSQSEKNQQEYTTWYTNLSKAEGAAFDALVTTGKSRGWM